MKSILIISFSNLDKDPRVNRQIRFLNSRYRITCIGFSDPAIKGVEFIPTKYARSLTQKVIEAIQLKTGLFEQYYWGMNHVKDAYQKSEGRHFDLIIANDLSALPLAEKLSQGTAGVIFDAHEYAPREFEDMFIWRFFFRKYTEFMCAKYIPEVDGMMTVCQGIADEYEKNYTITPVVIMNSPYYHEIRPSRTSPEKIRMIHHGIAIPSRRLELMIEALKFLDSRYTLEFMLMPSDPAYMEKLRKYAQKYPNLSFREPVNMQELPNFLNSYDIGIYILEPSSFNNEHALPNKLFEFIQARLAVVIAPSPEMAKLVRQFDCGIVADDFSPRSMADKLLELTQEKLDYYKEQSGIAAKQLCFEQNGKRMLELVEKSLLLSKSVK